MTYELAAVRHWRNTNSPGHSAPAHSSDRDRSLCAWNRWLARVSVGAAIPTPAYSERSMPGCCAGWRGGTTPRPPSTRPGWHTLDPAKYRPGHDAAAGAHRPAGSHTPVRYVHIPSAPEPVPLD